MNMVVDSVFTNTVVQVDGTTFRGCKFTRCQILYSGGELPSLIENVFTDCHWRFGGAAARTLAYLAALSKDGAKDVVKQLFAGILDGPPRPVTLDTQPAIGNAAAPTSNDGDKSGG